MQQEINKISVATIKLINFKGIKEFSADFKGENANIYGDNA